MSGDKIGYLKGKTGFGEKGYKPGSMIVRMNTKNPALKQPTKTGSKDTGTTKVAIKKTI